MEIDGGTFLKIQGPQVIIQVPDHLILKTFIRLLGHPRDIPAAPALPGVADAAQRRQRRQRRPCIAHRSPNDCGAGEVGIRVLHRSRHSGFNG